MRKLYEIIVVDKKTNEIMLEKKVAALSDIDAMLKASSDMTIGQTNTDVVIRELATLSKEPEVVHVVKERE